MADIKNTARNKRKYTEARKGTTVTNKAAKTTRHEKRLESLKDRTRFLLNRPVLYAKRQYEVIEVLHSGDEGYPVKPSRTGAYLRIKDGEDIRTVSRARVKPVAVVA